MIHFVYTPLRSLSCHNFRSSRQKNVSFGSLWFDFMTSSSNLGFKIDHISCVLHEAPISLHISFSSFAILISTTPASVPNQCNSSSTVGGSPLIPPRHGRAQVNISLGNGLYHFRPRVPWLWFPLILLSVNRAQSWWVSRPNSIRRSSPCILDPFTWRPDRLSTHLRIGDDTKKKISTAVCHQRRHQVRKVF